MQHRTWRAAECGNVEDLRICLSDSEVQINGEDPSEYMYTALHYACRNGHSDAVALLLAHPDVKVNQRNRDGCTPFYRACYSGRVKVVKLLLEDPRVDVNQADFAGETPLRWATRLDNMEIVMRIIASSRKVYLGEEGNKRNDAIGEAAKKEDPKLADLLRAYKLNPDQTRLEARGALGIIDPAAGIFAIVVFLCDDLLRLKFSVGSSEGENTTRRFFTIARQLPMELQMVLCHRAIGSKRDIVRGSDSEVGFVDLARRFP